MKWMHDASLRRKLQRFVSFVLIAVSLVFIAHAIRVSGGASLLSGLDGRDVILLVFAAFTYALSLGLLARAWRVSFADVQEQVDHAPAIAVYGASVLPKYLPGSVFQYASRQMLGRMQGWSHKAMARASLTEIALQVVAALLIGGLGAGIGGIINTELAIVTFIMMALLGWVGLYRWTRRPRLANAWLLQLAFFTLLWLLATGCAALVSSNSAGALEAGAWFMLAWLIGFVVPAAPGGIGVREAVLLYGAGPVIGSDGALLLAGATRLITLGGDVLFGTYALWLGRQLGILGRSAALKQTSIG